MSNVTATAEREHDGYRGKIIAADGTVRTRTANLYASEDKAIDGARRLWSFQLRQLREQLAPGGAA